MKNILRGWDEIATYLRLHPRTAQRYERMGTLTVRRPSGGGPKAPVYVFREELDDWLRRSKNIDTGTAARERDSIPAVGSDEGLFAKLLDQIIKARDTTLYRRNYFARLELTQSVRGLRALIEYEFALFNATHIAQPYMQEVTIDDRDRGYVRTMSVSANGRPLYLLRRPAITQKQRGYSVYHGPQVTIHPVAKGVEYLCQASWVEHREENDLWYSHMVLPTIGIEVETQAPPEFEITPSFSSPDLLMVAQHFDIAWNRRK